MQATEITTPVRDLRELVRTLRAMEHDGIRLASHRQGGTPSRSDFVHVEALGNKRYLVAAGHVAGGDREAERLAAELGEHVAAHDVHYDARRDDHRQKKDRSHEQSAAKALVENRSHKYGEYDDERDGVEHIQETFGEQPDELRILLESVSKMRPSHKLHLQSARLDLEIVEGVHH